MKVWVHEGQTALLQHPIRGFPFSHVEHEVAKEPQDADWVLLPFLDPVTSGVHRTASGAMQSVEYHERPEKYVSWALCDFPRYSVKMKGVKFLLSPMDDPRSRGMNCHPMPLHPCERDYAIAMDLGYTEECRAREKINNFAFLGKLNAFSRIKYGGRIWMRQVAKRVPKFFIRSRAHNALYSGWETAHREWMLRVAEAAYGFCPISGADATMDPRLYWTMQVGTVPIITQHETIQCDFLGFQDVVDWEELAVFVPSAQKLTFDYASLPMPGDPEYEKKRKAVMRYWDEYSFYPRCEEKLVENYLT